MRTQSPDTTPEAERVQLALLRAATPARRLAMSRNLSMHMIEASRRAVRKRHPELNEREALFVWIGLVYGSEMERRLRRYLEANPR